MENSPAHIGGILVGDIILKVNNTDIKSSRDLIDLIEKSQIGDTLKVVVLRNRKIENLSVKIKERP